MSATNLRWRALWQPEMYHGWGRTRNYFEGWYLKCITADQQTALAFIPGISMSDTGQQHAFVQVMYGSENRSAYHRFEADQFLPSEKTFDLQLARNRFSADGIQIQLPDIQGELRFNGRIHWPKMLGAPGIMGWFSFIPFMECFHGIVSMDHRIDGTLSINGRQVDFSNGRGYIEKDWGRSFPRGYVWMQSNHFGQDVPVSLIASVAHIPFLGSHFIGFISGFQLDGKLWRYATYTGAKKYLTMHNDRVELTFKNPSNELRILAWQAPGTALVSPMSGAMTGKINESLQARIQVELLDRGQRIFEGTGTNAGLEICLPENEPDLLK